MPITRPTFSTSAARLHALAADARRTITLTRCAAEDALAATRAALALNEARDAMRFPSNPLMRAMHDATAHVTRDASARMVEAATCNGHADLVSLFTAMIDASDDLAAWHAAARDAAVLDGTPGAAAFIENVDADAPCLDDARGVAFVLADARRWLDSIAETGRRSIPSSTLERSRDDLGGVLASLRVWRHRIDRMTATLPPVE